MNRSFSPLAYWTCQLLGWGLYAAANLLIFAGTGRLSSHGALALGALSIDGLVVTHGLRWVIRRQHWANKTPLSLSLHIAVATVVQATLVQLANLALMIAGLHVFRLEDVQPLVLVTSLIQSSILFLLWQVLYFGVHALQRYRWGELDRIAAIAQANATQLNALRSQLNPHFLFNSLNTLRALTAEPLAREAITRLSNLLRYSLSASEAPTVPFERELEVIDDYLALEVLRFEQRLQVNIDVDTECLPRPVPVMAVQTLVENAMKHGIAHLAQGGHVSVKARPHQDHWTIEVINTSSGRPAAQHSAREGVGLANTRERLRLLFGEKATLELRLGEATTIASMRLPWP